METDEPAARRELLKVEVSRRCRRTSLSVGWEKQDPRQMANNHLLLALLRQMEELEVELGKLQQRRSVKFQKPKEGEPTTVCPICGSTELVHLHDTAHGIAGTHMAGTERYSCPACSKVFRREEADQYGLTFILD